MLSCNANIDGHGDVNEVAIAHYNDFSDDILEKVEKPSYVRDICNEND